MGDDLKSHLMTHLCRDLLIDLYDMAGAQALKAFEGVRDHFGLDEKRARELVGQARFRMLEKGFVDVCQLHGGQLLPDGVIPGRGVRAFQPFMRFGGEAPGVVLGIASMPMAKDIPNKNQSRSAGVLLNDFLTPRLDLGDVIAKPGDIFVLFLFARDRGRPGMIEEVAVGVIDAEYKAYLLYEPVDSFLAGYAPTPAPEPAPEDPGADSAPLVRLRPGRKAFKPPETLEQDKTDESGGGDGA